MRIVKRGNGIKFLDKELELASFRALIGIYSPLVSIENPDDINEVLFIFQRYLYNEYERLYSFLKKIGTHSEACECMEYRLTFLRTSIEGRHTMAPSEVLSELDTIKKFKKLIHVQEVSVSCCIKLK
jgi:hypothetical protein